MKKLSLIVPVLNEEESVAIFVDTVVPILGAEEIDWEILFIDDGSTDKTAMIVKSLHEKDNRIKLLSFSRNFGKEAALTAGLEWVTGDAVIPMDVDLQDPPTLIPAFIQKWREGFDVVLGQRAKRDNDGKTKRATAGMFYSLFNKISHHPIEPNVGDFRLMDRRVIDETIKLRERNRFMKGLFAWVGFKTTILPYERPERAEGESKFNYWKLWNFALDGITSFSTLPLRIWTYIGGTIAVLALIYMIITMTMTLIWGNTTPGYTSLMTVILFLGAAQLISLGIIGEYLGRLYTEVKQRPIYIVEQTLGLTQNARDN